MPPFSTAAVDPNYGAPTSFLTAEQRFRRVGATEDELQLLYDAHQRRAVNNQAELIDWIRSRSDDDVRGLLEVWRSRNVSKPEVQAAIGAPDVDQSIKAVLDAVGDDPDKAKAAAAAERAGQNRTTLLAQLDKIASSAE